MEIHFSDHAKEQMADRDISEQMVSAVIENPEQRYNRTIDETVCQSRVRCNEKIYLLRIFVNFTKDPPVVISTYRTSKVQKYWGNI
ncbi:MAG: DUF4258 domain-containing protein [SAR324 cluster bacterium]|nr:DUF4258 domain-containing protein [SAR324 cluster bacterium]